MDFSFTFRQNKPGQPKPAPAGPSAAEEQWNAIRGCGITPRPKATLAAVTAGHDPSVFEAAPYAGLLCAMAGFDAEGEPFSDDVFRLWWGSINETGDVAAQAWHISRLAKGRLPIDNLADEVAPDEGRAALHLTLDGEAAAWEFALAESQLAPEILSGLAAIVAERGEGSRLAATDLGDGSWLLVCVTEEELNDLAQTTSLAWAWVE